MMSLFLPSAKPEIRPIHCPGLFGSGENCTVMSREPADVGSQVTVGGAVAPLIAIRAWLPLTMSGRDETTSMLSAAQALLASNAPPTAAQDAAARRQIFFFMPSSLLPEPV